MCLIHFWLFSISATILRFAFCIHCHFLCNWKQYLISKIHNVECIRLKKKSITSVDWFENIKSVPIPIYRFTPKSVRFSISDSCIPTYIVFEDKSTSPVLYCGGRLSADRRFVALCMCCSSSLSRVLLVNPRNTRNLEIFRMVIFNLLIIEL